MAPDPIDEIREATIDELLTQKEPEIAVAYFISNAKLAQQWSEAKAAVDDVRFSNDTKAIRAAKALVDELRPKVKEATRAVKFESLGRYEYEKLVEDNGPTDEQRKKARSRGANEPTWDLDKFPPLIISKCAIGPRMTLDQATEIWNSKNYNQGELKMLLTTALGSNRRSEVMSLGKEFERIFD